MSDFSREKICISFSEEYKQLTIASKDEFSRVCNRLLNENFIYGQIKEDKNDYFSILRMKNEIELYFEIIDYSLNWDSSYKIFYLKSKIDRNRLKLKKIESVLVLIFRKMYYVKSKEEINSTVNIIVSFEELLKDINQTNIYKDRLNKTDLLNSLKILKRYKIIDFDVAKFTSINAFEIYPTILCVVTDEDIIMLDNKLTSYKNNKEEAEENDIDENPLD